ATLLKTLPSCNFGSGEVVFCLLKLALEEQPPLRSLSNSQHFSELRQLFDIGICKVRSTCWILVVCFYGDDAISTGGNRGVSIQDLSRVALKLDVINFFQIETGDQAVGDRAALEHPYVKIVGILDAKCAASQPGEPAQCPTPQLVQDRR